MIKVRAEAKEDNKIAFDYECSGNAHDVMQELICIIAHTMKCRECGEEMYLDDKDFDFKGKYDNYWNCPKCQTSCIEQVRFSKPFKELWHSENNDNVKDYVVRCN